VLCVQEGNWIVRLLLSMWTDEAWSIVIASWNTLLLFWLGLLVWLRSPDLFSLAIAVTLR